MERKVGEIFTYKDKTYQVTKSTALCEGCAFIKNAACHSLRTILGDCGKRNDNEDVIFKEINNMENNQLNIEIPEGMEIDIKNTDLCSGIIKFRTKNIKYNDVYSVLKTKYNILGDSLTVTDYNKDKLEAIDKLLDIAKYYNKDWIPNWNDIFECKYYILKHNDKYQVTSTVSNNCGFVYFRTAEDAKAVIENHNFKDILDNIYK